MSGVFIRERRRHIEGEESHAKTEAEIGMMDLLAKEQPGLLEATSRWKRQGRTPLPESSKGAWP